MIGGTAGTQAFAPGVPIYENTLAVSTSYTISTGSSAMSVGPLVINSSVTVVIPAGSKWVVL